MLSGNHVENCLQRSPFDDRYQNSYEEHFAEPYGEGFSKAISLEAEVPPFMEKSNFQWMIIVLNIVLLIKTSVQIYTLFYAFL